MVSHNQDSQETGNTAQKEQIKTLLNTLLTYTQLLYEAHTKKEYIGVLSPGDFEKALNSTVQLNPKIRDKKIIEQMRYLAPEMLSRQQEATQASDLYSLGCVLYHLITGQPPFLGKTPLELSHQHMAEQVKPPHKIKPNVPKPISDIVVKLLAKLPQARYLSTQGLIQDLNICIKNLDESGNIHTFELGVSDKRGQFLIPTKLYGRSVEIDTLIELYTRSQSTRAQFCLIGGYSGIGKSALVRAIRPFIEQQSGSYIEGKFDQYHRDTPYSAIIEAFKTLVKKIISSTEEDLNTWRNKISAILGDSAQIIMDVIPELQWIIGEQPEAPVLTGDAAKMRFNQLFGNLLRSFATKEHPLVIFLDDLQWADFASLDLLKTFILKSNVSNLLIIAAYRDNEVDAAHPMMHLLEDLRKAQESINTIKMKPLSKMNIQEMIEDTFYGLTNANELSHLVMQKSSGNPFYSRQFLNSLVMQNALRFDNQRQAWISRLEDVRLQDVSENVVELMMQQLMQFSETAQKVLKIAACIGKSFDMHLLAQVADLDEEDILQELALIATAELIIAFKDEESDAKFKFVHDRVQQAAYSLAVDDNQRIIHQKIGIKIWQNTSEQDIEKKVFTIVDQCNQALELFAESKARVNLAELNLRASKRAQASMATKAAVRYLECAKSCMDNSDWSEHYALKFEIHIALLELNSILSDNAAFESNKALLLEKANKPIDKIKIRIREASHQCFNGLLMEAQETAREGFSEVGIKIPAIDDYTSLDQHFDQLLATFRRQTNIDNIIDDLCNLPDTQDEINSEVLRQIASITDAATITNPYMLNLVAVIGSLQSLQKGNSSLSSFMYTLLGQAVIVKEKSYIEGKNLALAALKLMEHKEPNLWSYGRARVHQLWFILHWSRHIEHGIADIEESLAVTRRANDPLFTGYLLDLTVHINYFLGRDLTDVTRAHQRVVEHCKPLGLDFLIGFTQCYAAAVDALQGKTARISCLNGQHVNETEFIEMFSSMPMIIGLYIGAKIPVLGYDGQWEEIIALSEHACLEQSPPFIQHVAIQFWRGVAAIKLLHVETNEVAQKKYQQILDNVRQYLDYIATESCASNVQHRISFLDALKGQGEQNAKLITAKYQRAIAQAEKEGYLLEAGYIAESMAQWLIDCKAPHFEIIDNLEKAMEIYATTHATGMEKRVSEQLEVLSKTHQKDQLAMIGPEDIQALLSAVQIITSHSELKTLLTQLIKIIIEASGAEYGCVIEIQNKEAKIIHSNLPREVDQIPFSIIRYVINTGESVIIQDQLDSTLASDSWDFSNDDYLKEHRPGSLLCQPIDRREPYHRVLYLEHQQLNNIFSSKRQQVLKWLIGQASISIENAELYGHLESQVEERTRKLSEANRTLSEQSIALIEAKEEALRAADSKAAFLANMSHEIRTPMNAIIGMTQLALKTDLNPKAKNHISKVNLAADHLLIIINDILDYSRIESGKLQLEKISFNLNDVIEQVRSVCMTWLGKRPVELHFDLSPDLPYMLIGDPHRLTQVLINLSSNALKFTQRGDVIVKIDIQTLRQQTVGLRFTVKDTGIGLTEEQLSKLFNAFQQADSSTTRKFGGTGLGLAICKRLVNAWGGEIWAESELGKGSTFIFTGDYGIEANPTTIRRMPLARHLSGLKAIVADESAVSLEITTQILGGFGFEVLQATTAEQVLTHFEKQNMQDTIIDIAMIDIRLTEHEGMNIFKMIRSNVQHARTHLFVTTPELEDSFELSKAHALNIQAVLHKPLTASTLLEEIGAALAPSLSENDYDNHTTDTEIDMTGRLLQDMRILLVDDNEMNLELAIELLKMEGAEVETAENGQLAINILDVDPAFDVVLMDCQMPVMDGYEATQTIRKRPNYSDIKIIAMTANAMPTDREKTLNAGMNDYIAKPLNPDLMYQTIRKWVPTPLHQKQQREMITTETHATSQTPVTTVNPPDQEPTVVTENLSEAAEHETLQSTQENSRLKSEFDGHTLHGIDIQTGLNNCIGRADIYRKQAIGFVKNYSNFAEKFDQAIQSNDVTTACRMAHSLKSSAATIGAFNIQSIAQNLEETLKESTIPDSRLITQCYQHIAEVIDSLTPLDSTRLMQTQAINHHELWQVLKNKVEDFDIEAKDVANQLINALKDSSNKASFVTLSEALNGYDFDTAEKLIAQIEKAGYLDDL